MLIPTLVVASLSAFAGLPAQEAQPAQEAPRPAPATEILMIAHHSALELSQILAPIAQHVRIVPDQRTNSLIVAGDPKDIESLEALVARLDRPVGRQDAGAPAPSAAPLRRTDVGALFPAASGELLIDVADGAPTMRDLLDRYAERTGQHLVIDEQTNKLLASSTSGLQSSLRVPAEQVQPFIEGLLALQSFGLAPLRGTGLHLLEVYSMRHSQMPVVPRSKAFMIEASQLEEAARHPAVMFTVVLELAHSDARQLANTMRIMVMDPNAQMLVPTSGRTMLVTAPGAMLAEIAGAIQLTDALEANTRPQVLPTPPQGGR